MNLKLIAAAMLFLISASAVAARVETEEAQASGAQANATRNVIGALSAPDGNKCDFGQPSMTPSSRPANGETVARTVCSMT